jgi:hypothetical protein
VHLVPPSDDGHINSFLNQTDWIDLLDQYLKNLVLLTPSTHNFPRSIYLMALQTLWNLAFFSFLIYTQLLGFLGWGINSSQGSYLHTVQHTHTHTPYIHALSGIRTHDPSVRSTEISSCLRPHGYRDRLSQYHFSIIKQSLFLYAIANNDISNIIVSFTQTYRPYEECFICPSKRIEFLGCRKPP